MIDPLSSFSWLLLVVALTLPIKVAALPPAGSFVIVGKPQRIVLASMAGVVAALATVERRRRKDRSGRGWSRW